MVHYLPAYLFHFRHRQTMNRVVTYDRMEVVLIARAVPIQYSSLLQIIQRLAQPVAPDHPASGATGCQRPSTRAISASSPAVAGTPRGPLSPAGSSLLPPRGVGRFGVEC